MTVNVKAYGKFFVVPSGTVKEVVDSLLDGTMDEIKAKLHIDSQRLEEEYRPQRIDEFGYVNFDNFIDGKPTIVGDFYKTNTTFGLKLSGKWAKPLSS